MRCNTLLRRKQILLPSFIHVRSVIDSNNALILISLQHLSLALQSIRNDFVSKKFNIWMVFRMMYIFLISVDSDKYSYFASPATSVLLLCVTASIPRRDVTIVTSNFA